MNKRIARTIANWRWWLLLPMAPVIIAFCIVHLCFRLALRALDTTEDMLDEIIDWARDGAAK